MSEELVFAVERKLLFPDEAPQGLSFQIEALLERCSQHGGFSIRSQVEHDPTVKQLIPYIVLYHENSLFCVHRLKAQSEKRLHDLLSVGIGGHMNPTAETLPFSQLLAGNAYRELNEELVLQDEPVIKWWAVVNDDSNAVGRVHTGLVGLMQIAPTTVSVRERDKMVGDFQPYHELLRCQNRFETWSQLVLANWQSDSWKATT